MTGPIKASSMSCDAEGSTESRPTRISSSRRSNLVGRDSVEPGLHWKPGSHPALFLHPLQSHVLTVKGEAARFCYVRSFHGDNDTVRCSGNRAGAGISEAVF